MIRLFLAFVLVINLAFGDEFSKFDSEFNNSSKDEQIRIYNDLKGIYAKSILNDEHNQTKEALKRIIQASKTLQYDYSQYQGELNKLDKLEAKSSVLMVLKIQSDSENLILSADQPISKDEITEFDINTKNFYKKVFDIKGALFTKLPVLKEKISPQLRIAQFDKNTIRIVFAGEHKQDISYTISNNKIIFQNKQSLTNLTPNTQTTAQITQIKNQIELDNQKPSKKIIVLDPGHGGKDAGAVGSRKLYEKHIVLKVAQRTMRVLQKRGYTVYLTRNNDKFIELRQRTAFANKKNANLFISIHTNAAPNKSKAKSMRGIETFFLSPSNSDRAMDAASLENKADTEEMNYFAQVSFLNFLNREKIIASNKLAIDIQSNLVKSVRKLTPVMDHGAKEGPFWVLVGALMPAVLVEIGYITHPSEGKLLNTPEYIDKTAQGIADGVDSYFAKNK